MESVRVWARGLFLLSVFSSTVMLLVPKSMVKQSKFVSELLILLCVIAPVAGLLRSGSVVGLPSSQVSAGSGDFSLAQFYANETAQRVTELGVKSGIPVEEVEVVTADGGLSLSMVTVHVGPGPSEEDLAAFQEAIGVYAGISKEKVKLVMRE